MIKYGCSSLHGTHHDAQIFNKKNWSSLKISFELILIFLSKTKAVNSGISFLVFRSGV